MGAFYEILTQRVERGSKNGKNPPNGGATAWSGGPIVVETEIAYIQLGSASPNFDSLFYAYRRLMIQPLFFSLVEHSKQHNEIEFDLLFLYLMVQFLHWSNGQ